MTIRTFDSIEAENGLWPNVTEQLRSAEYCINTNLIIEVSRGTPTWSEYPTTISNGWSSELRLKQVAERNLWLFSGYLDMCLRNSMQVMDELHIFFENWPLGFDDNVTESDKHWVQRFNLHIPKDPIFLSSLQPAGLKDVGSETHVFAVMPIAKAMFRDALGKQHIFSITPSAAYRIYSIWLQGRQMAYLDPRVKKIFIHVPKASFIGKELREDGVIWNALHIRDAQFNA